MLILDGTIPADVTAFLQRIHEDTDLRDIITYEQWLTSHIHCTDHCVPRGIVYMRILPAIAHARLQKNSSTNNLSLEAITQTYTQQEKLFIERENLSPELHNLPVLVLNGNVDFQTDFSQFYNHLFYIKRFLKNIQEQEDVVRGIHRNKPHHRHCC